MIIELSIIAVCIIILLTILVTLTYLGYFSHVEVKAGSAPIRFANRTFAYKSFKDNYSGIGFQFTVLHNLTAVQPDEIRNKFSDAVAVGIYYDNPDKVKDECKFTVGLLLIGESDCEEVKEVLRKENYEFNAFPDIDNVVNVTFPYKGSVSIPIAIRKVYPKLNDYIQERKLFAYPSMEFYSKDFIHFVLPLDKQQDFVFFKDETESSEDESETDKRGECLADKSPSSIPVQIRQKCKELRRSSSGSSFDELNSDLDNLVEDNEKNV